MNEDILLGEPALRSRYISINLGPDDKRDSITFHDSHVTVPLVRRPNRICSSKVDLVASELVRLPAGTGTYIKVGTSGTVGIMWPGERKSITGLIAPPVDKTYSALPMDSLNSLDHRSNTVIFVKNHTNYDRILQPGDTIAQFQPVIANTKRDAQGRVYLYPSANGTLHPKVEYTLPQLHGAETSPLESLTGPVSKVPVAVQAVAINDGQLAEAILNLSPEQQLRYMYCLLYTSPSPRDQRGSRMPSSA